MITGRVIQGPIVEQRDSGAGVAHEPGIVVNPVVFDVVGFQRDNAASGHLGNFAIADIDVMGLGLRRILAAFDDVPLVLK